MYSFAIMSNLTPTAQNALVHIISVLFPKDVTTLQSYFQYFSVLDIEDFITLDKTDFKTAYNTAADPSKYLVLPQ